MNLSVNLNKVALLRNSRGAQNPSPRVAAECVLDAGAHGLTLHWRSDNRHARADDVRELVALCRARGAEFNLEGDDRDELINLAAELRVTQFTLVPVKPGEITSDHGWDLPRQSAQVSRIIARLKPLGIRTAMFMDAVPKHMALAAQTGVDRVELYTEPYAKGVARGDYQDPLHDIAECARQCAAAGLAVNVGHDLNLLNTPILVRAVPSLAEASIGHALLADALYVGLGETVKRYLAACRGLDQSAPVTC